MQSHLSLISDGRIFDGSKIQAFHAGTTKGPFQGTFGSQLSKGSGVHQTAIYPEVILTAFKF